MVAALDAAPRDIGLDTACPALPAAASMIVSLVSVPPFGPAGGRPCSPVRICGIASRGAVSMRLLWRSAPLSVRPGGVPRASVTRWRWVPGLPQSVGLRPTSAPPLSCGQCWQQRLDHRPEIIRNQGFCHALNNTARSVLSGILNCVCDKSSLSGSVSLRGIAAQFDF
jgi:hypothetical protein